MDSLLDSLMSQYILHSKLVNRTGTEAGRGLGSVLSRTDRMVSSVSLAAKEAEDSLEALRTSSSQEGDRLKSELQDKVGRVAFGRKSEMIVVK